MNMLNENNNEEEIEYETERNEGIHKEEQEIFHNEIMEENLIFKKRKEKEDKLTFVWNVKQQRIKNLLIVKLVNIVIIIIRIVLMLEELNMKIT